MEWIGRFKQFFRDAKQHLSEEHSEREIWRKSGKKLKNYADQVGDKLIDQSKSASEQTELLSSSLGERLLRASEEIELWFQREKSTTRTATTSNISPHAGYTSVSKSYYDDLFEEDTTQDEKSNASSDEADEIPERSHVQKLQESDVEDEQFYRRADRFANRKLSSHDEASSDEEDDSFGTD